MSESIEMLPQDHNMSKTCLLILLLENKVLKETIKTQKIYRTIAMSPTTVSFRSDWNRWQNQNNYQLHPFKSG